MLAIARALPSSLVRAFRSPPERGVGVVLQDQGSGNGKDGGPATKRAQQPSFVAAGQWRWTGPADRTASIFWISTILAHRRHDILRICGGISASHSARMDGPGGLGLPSARRSVRDCQYSCGIDEGPLRTGPPADADGQLFHLLGGRLRGAGRSLIIVARTNSVSPKLAKFTSASVPVFGQYLSSRFDRSSAQHPRSEPA